MSDEPQLNQQEEGEQKPAKAPEPSTRDLIHEAAEDKLETHSEKRKKYREEILTSLPKDQDTDDKSPEEIYHDQIKKSYRKINGFISDMWEDTISHLFYTDGHEATTPTSITENGTKIYAFDQTPSVSSLVAHNPDEQEVYQMILLPPIDGKVKIIGLLYTQSGFELTAFDADSEDFENEGTMWALFDQDDIDAKNNSRPNLPILKYFDDLSDQLHSTDHTLPFFIGPQDIKLLTENYFPYLSKHPDVLSGPLPKFDSIKSLRAEPVLPQGNDPESIEIREIHYMLDGLVAEIKHTLEMAADKPDNTFDLPTAGRADSKIKVFGNGERYREIRGRDQNGYRYIVRWDSQQDQYDIYKRRPNDLDIEDFITIYTSPGKPLYGALGGGRQGAYSSRPVRTESKTKIHEYIGFLNNVRKTLRLEEESNSS